LPEPVAASLLDLSSINAMDLFKLASLLLVTLFVGLFVIRPIMKPKTLAAPLGLTAEGSPDNVESAEGDAVQLEVTDEALSLEPPDPVERLRQMIDERHDETVEVLRRWISEPKETTQ